MGVAKKKKKKDCIFRVSRMQVKNRSTEQALAAVCTVVALGTRPDCVLLPEALGPVALVFTLFFFLFLWLYPRRVEVPGPGVERALQLQQHRILNLCRRATGSSPLSWKQTLK